MDTTLSSTREQDRGGIVLARVRTYPAPSSEEEVVTGPAPGDESFDLMAEALPESLSGEDISYLCCDCSSCDGGGCGTGCDGGSCDLAD